MTGNLVFLALALGEESLPAALHSGVALAVFCLGAVAAGAILRRSRSASVWPRHVTWLLWAELLCFVAFAGLWIALRGQPGVELVYALIGLSAFGMGLQNAAARHLAVPGLTTTVATGALTLFMVDLPALGVTGSAQRRAAWTIAGLFVGAAVGATLMVYARVLAPLVTVATVAVVVAVATTGFAD